jgi:hypothetical protein
MPKRFKVTKPQRVRPLSVSIIGWFMLVNAVFGPLALLSNSFFFAAKQFPHLFLGFFFLAPNAYLIYSCGMLLRWSRRSDC